MLPFVPFLSLYMAMFANTNSNVDQLRHDGDRVSKQEAVKYLFFTFRHFLFPMMAHFLISIFLTIFLLFIIYITFISCCEMLQARDDIITTKSSLCSAFHCQNAGLDGRTPLIGFFFDTFLLLSPPPPPPSLSLVDAADDPFFPLLLDNANTFLAFLFSLSFAAITPLSYHRYH
jgi:hypothetical protein